MDKKIINELLKYLKMDGNRNFVAGKENIVIPAYVPGNFISAYESIKGSVYGENSQIKGYLDQIGMEIGENVIQNDMKVEEDLCQISMKVKESVYQQRITIGNDLRQSRMDVGGNINQNNMKVEGYVFQENVKVKEGLTQTEMEAIEIRQNQLKANIVIQDKAEILNALQNGMEVKESISQTGMIVSNLDQSDMKVGTEQLFTEYSHMESPIYLDQTEIKVDGLIQVNMLVYGKLIQEEAKIKRLKSSATIHGTYVLDGAKIEEFEGSLIVQDYSIKDADIPDNMIEALEEGKRRYQEARQVA